MDNKIKGLRKHLVIGFHGMTIYCFLIQLLYYIVGNAVGGSSLTIKPTETGLGIADAILTIAVSSVIIYLVVKNKISSKTSRLFIVLSLTNIIFYNILISTIEYAAILAAGQTPEVGCSLNMGFNIASLLFVLLSLIFLRINNSAFRIGYFTAAAFITVFALTLSMIHFAGIDVESSSRPFLMLIGFGFKFVPVVYSTFLYTLSEVIDRKEEEKEVKKEA